MNSKEINSVYTSPVNLNLEIDRICDAFETSYQRNEHPRIEDYLDETLGEPETQLTELVLVELAYRRKAGETITFEEYLERFPRYSNVLRDLSDDFVFEIPGAFKTPPRIENLESYEFAGSGSFAVVWKAWDTNLRRFVAVKTPRQAIPTPRDRELFLREARVVAQTKHPNIVPVFSADEKGGRVYIVYDFVHGMTLRERLSAGPMAPIAAAKVCVKIADAIHHVHQLGIVHRDLKPANIMLDRANEPHVMDFGLAKLIDVASTIGACDNPLGTPAYMSPEQAAGNSNETDARSDIYTLGVLLYELVSGKHVFEGSREDLIQKIRFHEPQLLSKLVPEIDRSLALICHKCLEKNKHDRYCTAAELASDLGRFINGKSAKARPVPAAIHFYRWINHHKLLTTLCLAIPLLFVALFFKSQPQPTAAIVEEAPEYRTVLIKTLSRGAVVTSIFCDPKTGEPLELSRKVTLEQTPGSQVLTPGLYLVTAVLKTPEGVLSCEVHRTVPGAASYSPSMGTSWEQFQTLPSGEVQWPALKFSTPELKVDMVLMPGTDQFEFDGPDGRNTVSISPFYVATREFTFGDLMMIRPAQAGNDTPAMKQRSTRTMPLRYDWAEHWAEESGCRLLTDPEFAYLAKMANEAQVQRKIKPEDAAKFKEAGGSTLDEIPTKPPIRGILTGYAEWTSTWATSPRATVDVTGGVANPERPQFYRIIRGGTANCGPRDYPRAPNTAAVASIYQDQTTVGFRLARTPHPLGIDGGRRMFKK
jgi:serine/threonine protein kinase